MKTPISLRFAILATSIMVAGACAAKDPDAQGGEHAHHTDSVQVAPIPQGATYIAADVKFMQGMIGHHGQAIAMTALAKQNGASDPLLRFALKMELAQRAEIDLMQNWLKDHSQPIPDSSAHQHMAMPGMLTAEQMKELAAARGADFDRLFLEYMIIHHEGALKMVADLMATPMAAQEPGVYALATDIDTDQRAEIARMQEMKGNL